MNLKEPEKQLVKRYSFMEFENVNNSYGFTCELIDDTILLSPRPAIRHQIILGNLHNKISTIMQPLGYHVIPEIELFLKGNRVVPDLSIIHGDTTTYRDSFYCEKLPRIIVEIVSPLNASHDYIIKRDKYEQLGIQEYWIVSPEEQCIWVFSFKDNEQFHYCDSQPAQSYVIPELTIDLNEIFV